MYDSAKGVLRMKRKLRFGEMVSVASMLFGLFFGAGNLIFPVSVGQNAGRYVWVAFAGLFLTAVGLPLMGVAALGVSRSNGLFDLARKAMFMAWSPTRAKSVMVLR